MPSGQDLRLHHQGSDEFVRLARRTIEAMADFDAVADEESRIAAWRAKWPDMMFRRTARAESAPNEAQKKACEAENMRTSARWTLLSEDPNVVGSDVMFLWGIGKSDYERLPEVQAARDRKPTQKRIERIVSGAGDKVTITGTTSVSLGDDG